MIRQLRLILPVIFGLAGAMAVAEPPAGGVPASSVPAPHAAHSDDPPPEGGAKANPADAASPPLADPLKQQAVTDPPQSLATPAVQFILQASMDSLTEVHLAQDALERSDRAKLRRFARRVLDEHRGFLMQLDALAARKSTSVPNILDSDHAAVVHKLDAASGQEFEAAYVTQFCSADDRLVASYVAASALNDVEVGSFAAVSLSTLRAERSQARVLQGSLPRVK